MDKENRYRCKRMHAVARWVGIAQRKYKSIDPIVSLYTRPVTCGLSDQ